ncbi:MAG: TolC family protein [Bacteroidota bacterium]|nr:TolC family protein [Bacteroidota bacterium]
MKIKLKFIPILALTLCINIVSAQEEPKDTTTEYSLQEIQNYAVKHNYEVQNTQLDIEVAKKQKWETTAIGLPRIEGSAEYQNFPEIPTQLMPNFITPAVYGVNTGLFGLIPIAPMPEDEKMPVQFGSKHNTTWGVTASQLLFSGEYIVGLKASKIYLELSKTAHKRKKEEVKETVSKTYYLILITEESISLMDSVYRGLEQLRHETEQLVEAGFAEQTDARQIELNVKNTENSLNSMRQQREILYRMLKFQSGLEENTPIQLSSGLPEIISEMDSANVLMADFDLYQTTDYRMLQVQQELSQLELMREKSLVLPQLSAYFSYSEQAMQEELDLFSEDTEWYPTSVWGIKLTIPIFASGQRWAKIKQKQYKFEKTVNIKSQNSRALQLDFAQTRSNYTATSENLENIEANKKLALQIYENTKVKYKEGTASGLELTQAQNQYFISLTNYYSTLGDLIDIHIKLKRLLRFE